jgi:hypothetical protein
MGSLSKNSYRKFVSVDNENRGDNVILMRVNRVTMAVCFASDNDDM